MRSGESIALIEGSECNDSITMSAPFLRALWLVCASKVYSGLGADIVMESLHSLPPGF